MSKTIEVDVVSAEESIFSGVARFVSLPGEQGELGVYAGHTPLLTNLVAGGEVRITLESGSVESIFIRGGMLEIQPHKVTVLADTAIRAADIDEAKLIKARKEAEVAINQAKGEVDLALAKAELAAVLSEIKTVEKLKLRK